MNILRSYFFLSLLLLTSPFLSAADEELKPTLTVNIPMRDGKELPTDLYLPSPDARHLPCILLRSSAGRGAYWKSFAVMSKAGYVVAIQDTRSALDLEGKTFPFISDGWGKQQDGYDTVEWLAKSPYTNGKIGTWGSSALGITQLLMAPSAPPHLECQYIIFAAASIYHHGLFPGGQLLKHQAESWLGHYARDTGVLNYVCQRPFYNEFWEQLNSLEVANRVKVPAIHVGGWYDTFLQGTLSGFTSRQYEGGKGARGTQKLVIGPWTHLWPMSQKLGDFEVPIAGKVPPYDISPQAWFDHYLKGIDNHVEDLPTVIYYVMGPFDGSPSSGNIWRTADKWPVPATSTPFYLTASSRLQKTPVSKEEQATYRYDPAHTIPTRGGNNLFLDSGPMDQRLIENRDDILVFTSDPLTQDLEITGPVAAKLFFSSDQKDTDVIVRLTDVYPDGRSILISEGGYRLGIMCFQSENAQAFKPDEPLEISIDLWATSLVFAKGHSIRVSVSSSNYPRYERNPNVGILGTNLGKHLVANNKVYMSEKRPSCIILPVIERTQTIEHKE